MFKIESFCDRCGKKMHTYYSKGERWGTPSLLRGNMPCHVKWEVPGIVLCKVCKEEMGIGSLDKKIGEIANEDRSMENKVHKQRVKQISAIAREIRSGLTFLKKNRSKMATRKVRKGIRRKR